MEERAQRMFGGWRGIFLLGDFSESLPVVKCKETGKEKEFMERLQGFQTAARQGGFVMVNETAEGTVLWLRKNTPDTARDTHQRMCIDSLTNSVTVYWMTVPGKVSSKTFRGVPALQEWIDLRPEIIQQR